MSGGFFKTVNQIPKGVRLIQTVGAAALALNLIAFGFPPVVTKVGGPVGVAIYATSFALFWWSIATNWRRPLTHAFTPDEPGHLARTGPYRLIRHPIYASYLLTWLAGPISTGNPWLFIPFALMLIIYVRAARSEEIKFESSPFAQQYADYQHRTGMFLPKI